MKLEEGMFIRFEGMINKILEIDEDYIVFDMNWYDHWNDEVSSMRINEFIKEYEPTVSDKLIDLIEVGDYVNGLIVNDIVVDIDGTKRFNLFKQLNCFENNDDIKSIVTKQQFEQMAYKVEE